MMTRRIMPLATGVATLGLAVAELALADPAAVALPDPVANAVLGAASVPPEDPADAIALGRIFFSADERARLDAERAGSVGAASATAKVAAGPVAVTGVVQRRGSRPHVWVNGSEAPATAGAVVRRGPDRSGRLLVETAGRRVGLKTGQAFDPATGRIRECAACTPRVATDESPAAPADGVASEGTGTPGDAPAPVTAAAAPSAAAADLR